MQLKGPEGVAEIVRSIIKSGDYVDRDKEHFIVLGLDNSNKIKYVELVTLGILNASLVHPREVFRTAIIKGVANIIIAHNHPSGSTIFSIEDKKITERLKKSGEIIDIKLLDSIVVTNESYKSMVSDGTF